MKKVEEIVKELTLEEKAGLCSGKDNWFTKNIDRLGIPSMRMSDGPHGLRLQDGNVNTLAEGSSEEAVCFPAACCTASSFDRELLREMGRELGKECQAKGVHVLLGPGINMKRSPLCGRNFEYFSEDPLVAGELGAAFVEGLQQEGVGACLKHFFANNQEHRRMDSSSEMDERTMREIYLTAFEIVVKKAQPWMLMASYNRIDGIFSTENKKYLTDMLRQEWGYEGAVVSDWGATHNRAAAVEAGCALTMPSATGTDQEIVQAVREGRLCEKRLDEVCAELLSVIFKAVSMHREGVPFNAEGGHRLAKRIADESVILLKNEEKILPLGEKRIAFIGRFAKEPRYQGGGSSHICTNQVADALGAAKEKGMDVVYAPGYDMEGGTTEELLKEAEKLAESVDVAVIFAGLPESMEMEGVDREDMKMSEGHIRLIETVCKANRNTVVVLHNGAPIELPWIDMPKAVLECYLGGEAVGETIASVLLGEVNPSGHLAETIPKRLQDNPSYLFFHGEGEHVEYPEKYFMGYRYYISKEVTPLFPFGYGLSYTDFVCEGLTLDKESMDDTETLSVSVRIKNTGSREGRALVQLYVAPPVEGEMIRPVRELKAFGKETLAPGESKEIRFELSYRSFAHWSRDFHDWRVESGIYGIQICSDAQTPLLEKKIEIHATKDISRIYYSMDMTMKNLEKTAEGSRLLDENIGALVNGLAAAGFVPMQAVEAAKAMGGGKINLKAVQMLAESSGHAGAGGGGIDTLLNQPVSMLVGFLGEEKRRNLIRHLRN